jgi:hypothetical protein
MASFREIAEQNIFPGESGGDYNALFGYSNREGGRYGGTRLTDMTVNQALDFSQPSGDYGQWVKGQVGHVATPMGAYQVVGTTLRAAQNGLGLTGNERMDEGLQDRIGEWIYQNQGSGAWEGWRGNQSGAGPQARVSTRNVQTPNTGNAQTRGILSNEGNQMAQQPQGLLGSMGIQRRDPNAQGETSQPFYNRRSFGDTLARMAPALGRMGVMGLEGPAQAALDSRNERQGDERAQAMLDTRRNQTREWIASQPNGEQFAAMFDAVGGDATLKAMQAANAPADQTSGMQNYDFLVSQGMDPETAMARAFGAGGTSITNNLGGGGQTAGWEAIDKAYADTWLRDSVVGLPDAANQAAQISGVLGQLENGVALTGTMVGVQPDFIRAITNPTAQDAKDRVEGVVQRSLRETLGAQFTAAEGDRLIARAYNVNLPPELNAARLRALYTQLEAVAGQKLGMRTYFNENGTLQGFNGATSIPTVDDFLATMDAAAPSPDAPPPAGAPNVGDERDGYRFKGGDPSQQSSWERI